MTDAVKSAEAAAAPVAAAASKVITHEVNAARQPLRNLIIAKPFGAVIFALIIGLALGGLIVHLV